MLSIAPLTMTVSTPAPAPFVLLVDDHEPSLSRLQKVVESSGYPCVATVSAPDALVVCDERRPSLVVTDLAMPRLDGRGLSRWLKARYPSIPIVLLTGEILDPMTAASFRRTFAAVLTKPLEVEAFLTLLDDLMPRASRVRRP